MKYLLMGFILFTSCDSDKPAEKLSSHWHKIDEFGQLLATVSVWKNDNTGTCVMFRGDSGMLELSKEDCQ